MIRTLLVDDERPALERLKKLLAAYQDVDVVGEAEDGLAALNLIERKKPDLVFLDIDMPELNGIEVARAIGAAGPKLVFATAYDEFALAAFDANAIDYLVKPISVERLSRTFERIRPLVGQQSKSIEPVLQQLQPRLQRMAVKVGSKYEVLEVDHIDQLKSVEHYTAIISKGREYLSEDSIDGILLRLDPNQFFRVHRSSAINLNGLKELQREGDRKYLAVLKDGSQIPISRERWAQLRVHLGIM